MEAEDTSLTAFLSMKSIVFCCEDFQEIANLVKDILQRYHGRILHAVPHTSRRPIRTEVNGVHGHFVSEEVISWLLTT
jgi:guanylate kinase